MTSSSSKYSDSSVAKAFKELDKESLFKFMESVWESFQNDVFPHLSEKKSWEVYLLHKGFFAHYSLLFTLPGCSVGFLIHLNKNEEDRVFLLVDRLDLQDSKYSTLQKQHLGTTEALPAQEVITAAHNRLVQMGDYHAILKNCQDYCQRLAKDFKLQEPVITGANSGSSAAIGSFAVGVTSTVKF